VTLHEKLESVFQNIFNDDELQLRDEMTAADVPNWDSVATINLMFSIEQEFGVQFAGSEFAELKNIGDLKRYLEARVESPNH
jgi:acyl carrier protein